MKLIEDMRRLLESGVEKSHFPGCHFGFYYKGDIKKSYVGFKQLVPKKEVLDGDEIYDVASLTKVISTTTLIMKLIEDQKLKLDTPVVDVIEWFKYEDMTVYDLLTHSSGLPADIRRANTLKNRTDIIEKIKAMDRLHDKGKYIIYSDIGFILLGMMVEKITGLSLHKASKQMIFEPLGMKDTSYMPDVERCAPTEMRSDDVYEGLLKGQVHDEKAFAFGGAGHAGLFSTVHDILIFIDAIINDKFVLKKETIDLMFEVQEVHPSLQGVMLNRALGWDKPTPGGTSSDDSDFDQTILHTGFTGCNMFIDRLNKIGFVMLSNAVHPKRSLNKIIGYRRPIAEFIYTYREV